MSYASFYLAAVCAVVVTVTVVYFGFFDKSSSKPALSEWCSYADRLLMESPTDPKAVASIYWVPMAIALCESDDPFYTDLLRRSDKFYEAISLNPNYIAMIEQAKENHSLPVESDSPRAAFLERFSLLINDTSSNITNTTFLTDLNSQVQLFCPTASVAPFVDRALHSEDYSGKSLLLAISSFYRSLSFNCPNALSTYRAQSQLLNKTAPAFSLFFDVDILSSDAYLNTNYFQARVGREDLNATLVSLKALYAKVNETSRQALLRIAGGLRLGFTLSIGTRSELLRSDVEIVRLNSGEVSLPFIARVEAVMNQSDFFLSGLVENPTALINLAEDDLSQWADVNLDSDIQVSEDEEETDESEEETDESEEETDEETEDTAETEETVAMTVAAEDEEYDHVSEESANSTEMVTEAAEPEAAPRRWFFWF